MTIREQAIRICAIAASAEWPPLLNIRIVLDGEFLPEAGNLADAALDHALLSCERDGDYHERLREDWAEAECLLREGWTP